MDNLTVTTQQHPDGAVVTVAGEIDLDTCPALEEATLIIHLGGKTLELEMSGVAFMGSTGLNFLLKLRRRLAAEGGPAPHHRPWQRVAATVLDGSMSQTAALRLRQAIARTEEATGARLPSGRGPEEADDVLGTFATDGALGFDPFPFLRAIHDTGSRAVVIGQVAGIMHGSTELTGDLDLLWDGTPGEAHALREALTACGCTELPELDRSQVAYRVTGADGDLCTPALPWGDMDVTPCLSSAETTRDPAGFTIRYAALDDLIRMRRALGRPKDHRRADELARLRT